MSRFKRRSSKCSDRKPLVLFDGIPGIGKTRLLQETAECIASQDTDGIAIFAVSHNGDQSGIMHSEYELEMIEISPQLPIVLRIMHTYLGTQGVCWGDFVDAALKALRASGHANELSIEVILTFLSNRLGKRRVLLLIDETLRWLDIGVSVRKVQTMVSAVCRACDAEGRAVIFAAMSATFLPEVEMESTRPIRSVTLRLLSAEASQQLTSVAIGKTVNVVRQYHLSGNFIPTNHDRAGMERGSTCAGTSRSSSG